MTWRPGQSHGRGACRRCAQDGGGATLRHDESAEGGASTLATLDRDLGAVERPWSSRTRILGLGHLNERRVGPLTSSMAAPAFDGLFGSPKPSAFALLAVQPGGAQGAGAGARGSG